MSNLTVEHSYDTETMLAYIDILGFKKFLETKPLPQIVKIMKGILKADNSSAYAGMLDIKTTLISDAFVIWAQPERPEHVTAFFTYLNTVAGQVHKMGGVITRGCVACGDHYCNENLWISPVFVAAYVGEQKNAIHPRIILDETAIARITKVYASYLDNMEIDSDGYRYINYLMYASEAYKPSGDMITVDLGNSGLRQSLEAHMNMILAGLNGDSAHRSKYIWLANYHNSYVRKGVRDKEGLLIEQLLLVV